MVSVQLVSHSEPHTTRKSAALKIKSSGMLRRVIWLIVMRFQYAGCLHIEAQAVLAAAYVSLTSPLVTG